MQIEVTRALSDRQLELWQGLLVMAATSHPEQDPRFAEVHRADGFEVAFALGYEAGDLVAAGLFRLTPHPFLKGRYSDAMAFSGPVCDDPARMGRFLATLEALPLFARVGRLRITPYWLGETAGTGQAILAAQGWRIFENEPVRHTGLIDITPPDTEILARFVKSARYECRKAERSDLQAWPIVEPVGARQFHDRLEHHRAEKGLGPVALPGFMAGLQHIHAARELGATTLFLHQGEPVGGWLAHCGAHTAHMVHVILEPDKLRALGNLRVAPFLWLDAIRWAKSRGARMFDVEGYQPDVPEDHPLHRVYRYKAELGLVPVLRIAGQAKVLNAGLHLSGNARGIARAGARAIRDGLRRRRPGGEA